MKYVSEIFALNLPCELDTCGDWHSSSLNWSKVRYLESENSIFKEYGIEQNKNIPEHENTYNVANHIRALLDLIVLGNFAVCSGMNNDFICNEKYDEEIFEKIYQLRHLNHWNEIDEFIGKEYKAKWLTFKKLKE